MAKIKLLIFLIFTLLLMNGCSGDKGNDIANKVSNMVEDGGTLKNLANSDNDDDDGEEDENEDEEDDDDQEEKDD